MDLYKDIHKDDDIYILASGKSVDYIDNSFFDNKIVIGINQAFKKIKCNYLVRKETKLLLECIGLNPDTIHFISYGDCGSNNNRNYNIYNNLDEKLKKNVVVYNHNCNNNVMPDNLPMNEYALVVSYSTIVSGIHLAAHMGAKNIILVGHDCGTLNGECNFMDYHTEDTYKIAWKNGKKDYTNWLPKIENDTIKLKGLLKEKYGCNVYSLNPFINFGLEGNIYKK